MTDRPGFTGSPLDRCDAARHDPALVAAMRADPAARLLVMADLVPERDAAGALAWGPLDAAPEGLELALLGRLDGVPRFVALQPGVEARRRSPELFELLNALPAGEAATYAAARSLVDWHAHHRFCAACGQPTEPFRAGWGRQCTACATQHFPRTDPVVIMLPQHGQGDGARVLVARQPAFAPGVLTALAGFAEPGESIEEAVAREVFEEAGLRTTAVTYWASQPWPFPSQLMIGCLAQVADDVVRLDEQELEAARWVTRAEVRAALAGAADAVFRTPAPHTVANYLLRRWAAGAD